MRAVSAVLCLASAAALAACSSDGSPTGGLRTDGPVAVVENAAPVTGTVKVFLRTWNRNPDAPTQGPNDFGILNGSSEAGKALATGRTTSSTWRVLPDDQMGNLVATLDANGFGGMARDGVSLKTMDEDPRRRGVIVVERDGKSRGLEYFAGAPEAETFRKCRDVILKTHSALFGLEAKAGMGGADDRQFQTPERIKLRR